MLKVDRIIRDRLSSEVDLINTISDYIIAAGGKRLRPALVLLVAQSHAAKGDDAHELAAVVEFIHTATLLHDDVVDESALRRGRSTANAMFGNAASVLVGDFLYSRAFQMMVGVQRMRVLQILSDATNVIAEGEVLQLLNMHDPDVTEESYLRVIRYKTAKLFEAAARLGAVVADCPPDVEEQAALFGQAIGTAFQLVDDALDYAGSTEELGKTVGDDLREGKATLPVIVTLARGTPQERATIVHAIREGDTAHVAEIAAAIRNCGALDATYAAARDEVHRATAAINNWPRNPATRALLDLCEFAVSRSF
ncbi:MAG: polyprenyl synthetase family protein [Betaproteobacteria bacterium]|nr:polyprenyl synthetase family protein [Betaproteobacteria bacterium]